MDAAADPPSRLTDWLPMELWRAIARTAEATYRALVLSFPEFARALTAADARTYRDDFLKEGWEAVGRRLARVFGFNVVHKRHD